MEADSRLFVNACLWVLRSGARWRDLPGRYDRHKSAHRQAASGKGEAHDQALGRSRGGLTTNVHMALEFQFFSGRMNCLRSRLHRPIVLGLTVNVMVYRLRPVENGSKVKARRTLSG